MEDKLCFAAVEFINDPNVVGYKYWYYCKFEEVCVGDTVSAPLGRHDRLQEGVVREVLFCTKEQSPYPFNLIKSVIKIVKSGSRS